MKTYGKVGQFNYSLVRRKGVRNVTMRVDEAGCVTVTAPYGVAKTEVEDIILKNREKLSPIIEKRNESRHTYEEGDVFLFEGENYTLTYRKAYQYNVLIEGKQFVATYFGDVPNKNLIAQIIKEVYRVYGYLRIKKMLPVYSKIMNVPVPAFTVRDSKKRWGSCSSQGTLSFSLRTQMLSDEQLSFLIFHELAHLVHFDHSADFHTFLRSHMPNYEEIEQELFSMEKKGLFSL